MVNIIIFLHIKLWTATNQASTDSLVVVIQTWVGLLFKRLTPTDVCIPHLDPDVPLELILFYILVFTKISFSFFWHPLSVFFYNCTRWMADFSQFTPYVYVLLVNSIFVSTVVFLLLKVQSLVYTSFRIFETMSFNR